MDVNQVQEQATMLAVKIGAFFSGIVTEAVSGALKKSLEGKIDELLKKRASDQQAIQTAIGEALAENGVKADPETVARAAAEVQQEFALVVNVEGGGTGRILTNGAEETIYGSQQINVKNGGVGEVVDGARKTIISEGGSNPALSVNVTNGGQGFVSRVVIDENGVHGGVNIIKIIK